MRVPPSLLIVLTLCTTLVDLQSNTADQQSNTANLQSNTANLQSNTADLHSDSADLQSNTADLQSNTADLQSNTADLYSDSADLQSNTADLHSNTGYANTNVIHGRNIYPSELSRIYPSGQSRIHHSRLSRIYPSRLSKHYYNRLSRFQTYVNTPSKMDGRQVRAFSPLANAWKAILRNSVGIAGESGKAYVKVGNYEDAVRDFNSLHPTRIQSDGLGDTGRVNSYDIMVFRNAGAGDSRSSTLYVLDFGKGGTKRAVIYFKTQADADAYIHRRQ